MQLDLAKQYIVNRLKEELSPDFTYHNDFHTEDVYEAARWIALNEGVEGDQLQLLLTAALFHDAGFLINAKGHELLSCTVAETVLPAFGYTETDIELINKLILATEIPQQPQQLLEEIICDADLDYLGRDDFFVRSELLYEEMCNLGTIGSRGEYNKLQFSFLSNHRYFTETSRRFRNAKKEDNFRKLTA